MFCDGGRSSTLKDDDWSKPPIFDEYLDNVHVDNMLTFDAYQVNDVIDRAIFGACQDIGIEDVPTFDVYFVVYFNSIFHCNNLEANTLGIVKHFDSSFNKDVFLEIPYFEDPFNKVYLSKSHLVHDLIMCH